MKQSILLMVPCVVLAGCENFPFRGTDCTLIANYGLAVSVVDSITNAPRGAGALVTATDGSFTESTRGGIPTAGAAEPKTLYLVSERKGTYNITVTRDGYALWQKSGVKVTGDECHVRTQEITARLKALP